MIPAPKIDKRSAADIAKRVRDLLEKGRPQEKTKWSPEEDSGDFGDALVQIFAHFAKIVIDSVNRAPEKNLLAYLDMLGASLRPPLPARAPLAFSLAQGAAEAAVIPARTQVAGPPSPGGGAPVIFETERGLAAISASLDRVFFSDPKADRLTDLDKMVEAPGAPGAPTPKSDHALFIGLDELLGRANLLELALAFDLTPAPSPQPREIRWSIVGGDKLEPSDQTGGLVKFSNVKPVPRRTVDTKESRWLCARLEKPLASADTGGQVTSLAVSARIGRANAPLDRAFANAAPLDVTKDFLPFGERPRVGDALYLLAGEAFSEPGDVTLDVKISAPSPGGAAPPKPAKPSAELKWEFWTGEGWADVTPKSADPMHESCDTTQSMTSDGTVKLRIDRRPARLVVNGADGYWIRVRIASGNYGEEASYKKKGDNGYEYKEPTLGPPSIASINASFTRDYALSPDRILTRNEREYSTIETRFKDFAPFRRSSDPDPTLYLGFRLPDGRDDFPKFPVAFYIAVGEAASKTDAPCLVWECSGAQNSWLRVEPRDETHGLARSGVIEFLAPAGFTKKARFGEERYWLRCRAELGKLDPTQLRRAVLNVVMAENAETILDETLGSSDGSPGQSFVTARRPVLEGQILLVREPGVPPANEEPGIEPTGPSGGGQESGVWVRWKETPDFYGSGPRDQHYVINHLTGAVTFGGGANGLAPPSGRGNIRLARYRTGGGSAGNCAASAIAQLKTTIPFVAGVANISPAGGGADAETFKALRKRAPRAIRHGDRAVTREDYEDLAMLASPEIARAYAPRERPGLKREKKELGAFNLIIVPRANDDEPKPSPALLERVRAYLDARRLPVVDVRLFGPDYTKVNVTVDAVLTATDRAVETQPLIVEKLRRFLHPLSGGFDGAGWDFGRLPQDSECLRLIGGIGGVDHVRSIKIAPEPEKPEKLERMLVSAGRIVVTVTAPARAES